MLLYGALKCGTRWIPQIIRNIRRMSKILPIEWSANYAMDDECERSRNYSFPKFRPKSSSAYKKVCWKDYKKTFRLNMFTLRLKIHYLCYKLHKGACYTGLATDLWANLQLYTFEFFSHPQHLQCLTSSGPMEWHSINRLGAPNFKCPPADN